MKFQNLNSTELLQTLKNSVAEERRITVLVLELLEEVESRKLYLQMGFASLFEFCIQELKYSESAAYRRIQAMRARRDVPEIGPSLEDGRLTLAVVARAQSFVRMKEKETGTFFDSTEKKQLFGELENKSAREAERTLLAKLSPPISNFESIRSVTPDLSELKIFLDSDLRQKLDRIKDLISHQKPAVNYTELITWLAESALSKIDPLCKATPTSVERCVQKSSPGQRVYISALVKRQVWKRAQGQCCFRDPQSGRRCSSRFHLQIDHIVPLFQGGGNELANLQLLCRAHNQQKGSGQFHFQ